MAERIAGTVVSDDSHITEGTLTHLFEQITLSLTNKQSIHPPFQLIPLHQKRNGSLVSADIFGLLDTGTGNPFSSNQLHAGE